MKDTKGLLKCFKEKKLERFDNLLKIFFYMLEKNNVDDPSITKLQDKFDSARKDVTAKEKSTKEENQSEKTSIGGNKSTKEKKKCKELMTDVQKKKMLILQKIDKFQLDVSSCLEKFLKTPFEFRFIQTKSLNYPIFRYIKDLKLVFRNENFEDYLEFDRFAKVIKDFQELERLRLCFDG